MPGFDALGRLALTQLPPGLLPINNQFLPPTQNGRCAPVPGIGLNLNLIAVKFPNNQYDWAPAHRARLSPVDLSVSLNPNLFKNPVPFLNQATSSWRVADFIPPTNPYNQNLYTVVVVSVPFNQYDWPRTTRLRGAFDQTQAFNPNLQTNPFPFQNIMVPSLFQRPTSSPDIAYNQNLFTNPFPFNQYDWSHSVRIAGFDEQPSVGINPNIFTNPFPFSTQAPAPLAKRTFTQAFPGFNPNLSVVVTTVPILNFASTITYRFRISLPDNSVGFLITRPVTPPPSTTLIQRTLTGVGL